MAAALVHTGPGVWEREEIALPLPPAQGCPLSSRLRSRGARLLNQQFWLWGQDVRRIEGNRLCEYGFAHFRPPLGTQGSHAYLLGGGRLTLWGFGLIARWGAGPEIYVGRFRFEPRFRQGACPLKDIFLPTLLAPLASPRGEAEWDAALSALAATTAWIAAYERWVTAQVGDGYRAACLSRWSRTACAADEIAPNWDELAATCHTAAWGRCRCPVHHLGDLGLAPCRRRRAPRPPEEPEVPEVPEVHPAPAGHMRQH